MRKWLAIFSLALLIALCPQLIANTALAGPAGTSTDLIVPSPCAVPLDGVPLTVQVHTDDTATGAGLPGSKRLIITGPSPSNNVVFDATDPSAQSGAVVFTISTVKSPLAPGTYAVTGQFLGSATNAPSSASAQIKLGPCETRTDLMFLPSAPSPDSPFQVQVHTNDVPTGAGASGPKALIVTARDPSNIVFQGTDPSAQSDRVMFNVPGLPAGTYSATGKFAGSLLQNPRGDYSRYLPSEAAVLFCVDGLVVTNTDDDGCGTLRHAINIANSRPGADTITFNVPNGMGMVSLLSPLPPLSDPAGVIIDGTGQSVTVNSLAAPGRATFDVTSSSATIRGIQIASSTAGISVNRNNCGGAVSGINVLETKIQSHGAGVAICGTSITDVTISRNFSIASETGGAVIIGSSDATEISRINIESNRFLTSALGTAIALSADQGTISNVNIGDNGNMVENGTISGGPGPEPNFYGPGVSISGLRNIDIRVSRNRSIRGAGSALYIGKPPQAPGGFAERNENISVDGNGSITGYTTQLGTGVSLHAAVERNIRVTGNNSIVGQGDVVGGVIIGGPAEPTVTIENINIDGNPEITARGTAISIIGASGMINNVSVSSNGIISAGTGSNPAAQGVSIANPVNRGITVANNQGIIASGHAVTIGPVGASSAANQNISVTGNKIASQQNAVNVVGASNDAITVGNNLSISGGRSGVSIAGRPGLSTSNSNVSVIQNKSITGGATDPVVRVAGVSNSNVQVRNNDISGGMSGVNLSAREPGQAANVVAGNNVHNNLQPGIVISGTSNIIGGADAAEGNVVRDNGGAGVVISSGAGNRITRNSISSNGQLGLDLRADGVTPNDHRDADTGANNLQNFPMITSVTNYIGSGTTIRGTLNSTPGRILRIEFFANDVRDPSGYGEGQKFVGTTDVTTDASGNASFVSVITPAVPVGKFVTATATDVTTNDTSEFSGGNLVIGAPDKLALAPKTGSGFVDTEHCVTATVVDALGTPTPGVTVRFSINGSMTLTGTAVTDAAGKAVFCYTSTLPGGDTISAFADTNGSQVRDTNEPADSAAMTWLLPPSTASCKVTYGGTIASANGDRATFGGNAQVSPQGAPRGEEQFTDHGPAQRMNVHSIDVLAIVCSGNSASIFGNATIDGAGSVMYRIDLKDLGEPGNNDTYRIRLSQIYDSGERPVLQGGNIQLH